MLYPRPTLTPHCRRGYHAIAAVLAAVALLSSVALQAPTFAEQRAAPGSSGYVAEPPVLPVEVGLEEISSTRASGPTGLNAERWRSEGVFLVGSSSWSQSSRAMVDDALLKMPSGLRAQLGNAALGPLYISVNREGRTISGQQPYRRPANFFSTNEGRNEVVLFPDQTSRTAMHELGHAYNLRNVPAGSYAQVYLDDEMTSFLQATGWRLLTPTGELRKLRDHAEVKLVYDGEPVWSHLSREDPLEDFANSFALYFTAPVELKALSEARYLWFDERFARGD